MPEVVIGFTDTHPQYYRNYDGHAAGFVVDAFNEAARREGIQLQWQLVDEDQFLENLRNGTLDIWPAEVITPERAAEFHITRPWWRTRLLLLSRADRDLREFAGKTVGHTRDLKRQVAGHLGYAVPVTMETHAAGAIAVCRGDLDGVLIDRLILDQVLLNRPSECTGVRLNISGLPDMWLEMAMLARRDKAGIADRLRDRIQDATDDGTLARFALNYPGIAAASAGFVATLLQTRSRLEALRFGVIILLLLLLLCAGLIWKLRLDVLARRRAEGELRRAYHDLEQFAYASHHDLREPLRNMTLFSQMLQRRGFQDPRASEHLEYIANGAERMSDLLDAVRAYTQIAADPEAPQTRTDATEALQAAIAKLRERIDSNQAVVRWEPLPPVIFDPNHLTELFHHLIDNAIKFRSDKPPEIHVSAAILNGDVEFSVSDNGIGIGREYHTRVFGVFKRLHGREVPGTGIGLAICRKVVETHGGRIWVESEDGKGATFHFTARCYKQGRRASAASASL